MIVGQYRYFQPEIMPRSRDRRGRLSLQVCIFSIQRGRLFMPKRGSLHCKETPSSNGEGRFLVLSSSFLCTESQPRYASTLPLQVSFRQALLPLGEAGRGFKRAFPCFVFIVSVYRSIASSHTNPTSSNSLPLGTSPPLEGFGEAFNDTILPYWNIMCIFVMFVL